jgi:hypothetical protein
MMEQLLPKVNDGVSVGNFVLELKDLRRMFDFQTVEKLLYVCGLTSQLARKWRRWKTLPQSFQNNPIQTISNDYLNWNFGWKPFVGDLFAMYKALKGLGKRLDYLERHQGRVLRRRRGIYLDVPDLPGGVLWSGYQIQMWQHYGPSGNGQEYDAAYIRRDNSYDYQPRYQATIDYTYTFPQGVFGETRRKIRGFLDSLGFKLDASIVWNAIPFSFVVDWIIDVGGWLRQFSTSDLGMEVVIHDASHSVKWAQVASVTCTMPINDRPAFSGSLHSYTWEVSVEERYYYERARWRPSLELTDGFNLPSFMQFSLGGALAGTRNKKKFRSG